MPQQRSAPVSSHGKLSEDGQSFVIPRPDVSTPLVNVISTGDYGVAVAQTGAGCSWGRRPSDPVTRGSGHFTRDAGGRSLYLRDDKTGRAWSAGWQPLRAKPSFYECIHGVGHTLITSHTEGIQAQWLVFVPFEEPLEVWRLRLKNLTKKPRTMSLWTGVEWASHRAASEDETSFVHDGGCVLLAKAHPSTSGGREGVFFHAVNLPTRAHASDRRALWGPYGSPEAPEALKKGRYLAGPETRKGGEPFASLCVPFTLKPGEERSVLFTVGCAEAQSEALLKARKFQDFAQVDHAWNRTQMFWDRYLSSFTVRTPDAGFDALVNTWLKYQALSQGLWGGRGPRDARIFLPLEPSRVRREVLARAGGEAGDVPFAASSDVPWPALLLDYLRETGEGELLAEKAGPRASVYEAASKALKEIAALPSEEEPWNAGFFSDWADMILWAVEEGHLAAREKEAARRWKAAAARRRTPASRNGGNPSVKALEETCAQGKAREAWDLFKALAPAGGGAPAVFSPEAPEASVSAAALFRACAEGILGLKPVWNGLRVKPCLPPAWRSASVTREFRGALYTFRIQRKASKPAGFQEIVLNGKKLDGHVLPVMFGRKNDVAVTVGRAK